MISKELLSEVLNLNMWKTDSLNISIDENKVYCNGIFLGDLGYQQSSDVINIYELAHKCKEWAYKQGYSLKSEYAEQSSYCGIYLKDDFSYEIDGSIMRTEPEAIFNACQWILDKRSKNDNI